MYSNFLTLPANLAWKLRTCLGRQRSWVEIFQDDSMFTNRVVEMSFFCFGFFFSLLIFKKKGVPLKDRILLWCMRTPIESFLLVTYVYSLRKGVAQYLTHIFNFFFRFLDNYPLLKMSFGFNELKFF